MFEKSSDRIIKRVASFIPIDIFFENKPIGLNARLTDLTPKGAFIEIDCPIEHGNFINFNFELLNTTIHGRAIVKFAGKRQGRQGLGVEFESLNKEQKITLYKILAELI